MNDDGIKEKSFEEAISRLEKIITELEQGEPTLDENLKLFEEGIALARHCRGKLDEAQGKVEILLGIKEGVPKTEDFQLHGEEEV